MTLSLRAIGQLQMFKVFAVFAGDLRAELPNCLGDDSGVHHFPRVNMESNLGRAASQSRSPGRIRAQRCVACSPVDHSPAGHSTKPPPLAVVPARYVLLPLANAITGYTVKAMERKIERGDWAEGKVWRRAPDGRVLIDILGYQRWVESP
jgi:hypothetical protein